MRTSSTKGRKGGDEVGLCNLASGINVMGTHYEQNSSTFSKVHSDSVEKRL